MGKKLIIAEKPSLGRTIMKALFFENWQNKDGYAEGENYICSWCFGHLFELYNVDDYFKREKTLWKLEELPFIPKEYKYKIKSDKGVQKQLKTLEELILRNDITGIVHCGDADNEGCKIVNDVIDYCFDKNKITKPVERLWFSAQNELSIREDIKKMKDNEFYKNHYNEACARTIIDYCIGINYSRALSLIAASCSEYKVTLPQGRVLGCIVKYIYDRHKEQEEFEPKNYTNIGLVFKNKDKTMLILKDSIYDEEEQYKALELLNRLNSANTYVKEIEEKEIKKQPNRLFSLTTLQNTLAKQKFSAQDTLTYTQKLYEIGYLTYPRAKSEYLPETEKGNVMKVLEVFKKDLGNIEFRDTPHIFDTSKVGSDHSAIIPTTKVPKYDELTGKEKVVYDCIKNRFLSNFCTEPCIIKETKIIIANSDNDKTAELKGIKIIQKGFLVFENNISDKPIPFDFQKGEQIDCDYVLNDCVTKPPTNVTPKELNNFLENPFAKEDDTEEERYKKLLAGLEIGTVATRSGIIENAKKYEYIAEAKGVYTITSKGIYFIDTAEKLGLLMSKEQTATLGKYLQGINDNKITVDQCVNMIHKEVKSKVVAAKQIQVNGFVLVREEIGKCVCGKNIYESAKVFYCEGFKDKSCDFILNKKDKFLTDRGKSLTKPIAKKLIKTGQAKVTGLKKKDGTSTYDAIIKIVKNGNYYNLNFAEKEEIKTADLGHCPRCGQVIAEGKMNYYCTGYKSDPSCKYSVWKEDKYLKERGIKLSKANIKSLIAGKRILSKDITRKDGKGTYNANIYLEDTGTYVNYKFEITK